MLGTGPVPTEVAIDERGTSVSVLLDAGRERRAEGGGVETEDRSPATPVGNEVVESTESRGWMACGVPGCIVGQGGCFVHHSLYMNVAWGMSG